MLTTCTVPSDFDDLLGSDISVLDRPLLLTTFPDERARTKTENTISLRQFAQQAHKPIASSKTRLPLLKLAKFGDAVTDKQTIRHNDNVVSIDGIEGDYDLGTVTIPAAERLLKRANIAAFLYSSPSHQPDNPRWRVLFPLGRSAVPEDRERLCARANGALGGILASESFTLSQSYYFGSVEGATTPIAALIEGRPLDEANDLDTAALGRNGEPYRGGAASIAPASIDDDDDWQWQAPADWDRIDSALAAIPITDADDQETGGRDMWLHIGLALHQVSGGSDEGFKRWNAWSQGGAKYDARHIQRDWKSFRSKRGKQVRIGTLYELAKRYGWKATAPVSAPEPDPFDLIGTDDVDDAKPAPVASKLRFLDPIDCASSPPRGYVIKGLIAPKDLVCIFGAPGAGKSLIAPHLGYLATLARPAFGMRTKPGRVFYVAAEDPHGMRGRVTSLKIRHGDAPNFILVDGVSDLLADDSPDLLALRAAIAKQRPSMVFLDTLAISFPGLEENSADGMGRVVAIARSLSKYGAAVILIHHDTKTPGGTPRGHSLLNGALDVALQLFSRDEGGVVRGKLTKNRNGSCDRDIAFRIGTETLGQDEDGDDITAALVDELKPGAAPVRERLTDSERGALQIFETLSINAGGTVLEANWRTACIKASTVSASDKPDSRRKAVARAFEGLVRKGFLIIADGQVRRPGSIGNAFDDA